MQPPKPGAGPCGGGNLSALLVAQRLRGRSPCTHNKQTVCGRSACCRRGRGGQSGARRAFRQALQQLGWIEGRNIRIDYRWGGGDADAIRKYAAEFAASPGRHPGHCAAAIAPMLQADAHGADCVCDHVPDPVGAGFVDSLARPGGNATGFMQFEYSLSGKWLELSKRSRRRDTGGVLRDPPQPPGSANSPPSSPWRRRSA